MQGRLRRQAGFTLIEVMIVVAIVAILAAIGFPSYLDYVRKGKRSDARSLLQAASMAQEKYRLNNLTYANATTALSPPCPTSGNCDSEQGNYRLAAPTNVTGTTYTLTANAISSMQSADTGCTAITVAVSGTTITYGPSNACWGK